MSAIPQMAWRVIGDLRGDEFFIPFAGPRDRAALAKLLSPPDPAEVERYQRLALEREVARVAELDGYLTRHAASRWGRARTGSTGSPTPSRSTGEPPRHQVFVMLNVAISVATRRSVMVRSSHASQSGQPNWDMTAHVAAAPESHPTFVEGWDEPARRWVHDDD